MLEDAVDKLPGLVNGPRMFTDRLAFCFFSCVGEERRRCGMVTGEIFDPFFPVRVALWECALFGFAGKTAGCRPYADEPHRSAPTMRDAFPECPPVANPPQLFCSYHDKQVTRSG